MARHRTARSGVEEEVDEFVGKFVVGAKNGHSSFSTLSEQSTALRSRATSVGATSADVKSVFRAVVFCASEAGAVSQLRARRGFLRALRAFAVERKSVFICIHLWLKTLLGALIFLGGELLSA